MLKPEMIPDKVWSAFTDAVYSAGYSKQALAAAINAWPEKRSDCDRRVSEKWIGVREFPVLILPLPEAPQGRIAKQEEAGDETIP